MNFGHRLFLGIDIGTGGVRAMAVAENGDVVAAHSVAFDAEILASRPDQHEQPPQAWWQATCQATAAVVAEIRRAGFDLQCLTALAVDGTSGTLVALDGAGQPLRPALMYNDPRPSAEAEALNSAGDDFCQKLGYRFNASFALAKIAWLRNHEPDVFAHADRFIHQADYIVEQLTGQRAATDYSNALKTGYDLIDHRWPEWLDRHMDVASRLPHVVAPGVAIGVVSANAAQATGLPQGMSVVAGATDGVAAFFASGARRPGDYNTTLGTTLVFKGISTRICRHADGIIYCHKLPGPWWLPGAASNTGADWIAAMFPGANVPFMDAAAAGRLPNNHLSYPLIRAGERFPFLAADARGFFPPDDVDPLDRYAACLQGVGLLERLGYQILDAAAETADGEVFSTGGGSRSDVWMQCRADATGRTLHRPACGESAFGAAVLAAAGSYYNSIDEAIEPMVRIERTFTPEQSLAPAYSELFNRFGNELRKRGYL